jgi:biopolymer transport protein TolQ
MILMDMSAMSIAAGTGPVVKIVLFILIFFSVVSWAIIFSKWSSFRQATKQTENFLDLFWTGKSLDNIFSETKNLSASHVSNSFRMAYQEFQKLSAKSKEHPDAGNNVISHGLENVQRALKKASAKELIRLEKMLPQLATIASVAPFIGLFGTVWGIMDSFSALGAGGPATLQRVAPGISEALIATAIGLAAAIPAVIGYNQFIHRIRLYRSDLDSFNADFTNILKRSYLG